MSCSAGNVYRVKDSLIRSRRFAFSGIMLAGYLWYYITFLPLSN